MSGRKYSIQVKTAAVLLWTVSMVGSVGGILMTVILAASGVYNGAKERFDNVWPWEWGDVDRTYRFLTDIRYWLIVLTAVCVICMILLLVYLFCLAGHRGEDGGVIPGAADRVPLDLLMVVEGAAAVILLGMAEQSMWLLEGLPFVFYALAIGIWTVVFSLMILFLLMTAAVRCKLGTLLTNTVIWRALRLGGRALCGLKNGVLAAVRELPLIGKTVLLVAGVSFLEFIFLLMSEGDIGVIAMSWLLEKIVFVPLVLIAAVWMRRLQKGGKELAEGHLDYRTDTRRMIWDFRKHGENLNSISEGMNKAVEEKLKSERFKTELITNVSHDIKTPLTSIINYVDLIGREEIGNEKAAEYIEVLDRQSKRLKKLIEDLVEASKASTGNINVEMSPTAVGVVLQQAAGEYDGRMNEKQLEVILNQPQEEVMIMADGRLLWRVFDNLLSNICKYALSGTRVYLNLEYAAGKAIVTFRNISAYPLNISSDELMERFTRGDSSRHTEGSGLGLSIAKSLTELQKGEMSLYTDGDLFKVVLTFNRLTA